jgi:hypothetical protein
MALSKGPCAKAKSEIEKNIKNIVIYDLTIDSSENIVRSIKINK